jgi:hypothetical protein
MAVSASDVSAPNAPSPNSLNNTHTTIELTTTVKVAYHLKISICTALCVFRFSTFRAT